MAYQIVIPGPYEDLLPVDGSAFRREQIARHIRSIAQTAQECSREEVLILELNTRKAYLNVAKSYTFFNGDTKAGDTLMGFLFIARASILSRFQCPPMAEVENLYNLYDVQTVTDIYLAIETIHNEWFRMNPDRKTLDLFKAYIEAFEWAVSSIAVIFDGPEQIDARENPEHKELHVDRLFCGEMAAFFCLMYNRIEKETLLFDLSESASLPAVSEEQFIPLFENRDKIVGIFKSEDEICRVILETFQMWNLRGDAWFHLSLGGNGEFGAAAWSTAFSDLYSTNHMELIKQSQFRINGEIDKFIELMKKTGIETKIALTGAILCESGFRGYDVNSLLKERGLIGYIANGCIFSMIAENDTNANFEWWNLCVHPIDHAIGGWDTIVSSPLPIIIVGHGMSTFLVFGQNTWNVTELDSRLTMGHAFLQTVIAVRNESVTGALELGEDITLDFSNLIKILKIGQ